MRVLFEDSCIRHGARI